MIVLSARRTSKLGPLVYDISRIGSSSPTREREENGEHTTRRSEDHVGVFGGGGDSGDPALVAGHRAEVAKRFHGGGVVVGVGIELVAILASCVVRVRVLERA